MKANRKKLTLVSLTCVTCLLTFGCVATAAAVLSQNHKETVDESDFIIKSNNIKSERISDIEYKLVATVYPEYNFNKSVDWNSAFKDSTSTWASGKKTSDYIDVKVDPEDQTICNIKLKEAFGEQIIMTCSSTNYPDIKASCTIDYQKKIEDFNYDINKDTAGKNAYISDGESLKSYYDVVYSSVYSLDKEFSDLKLDVDIYPEKGEPGVNTIQYDSTGKTINYKCVVNYLTSLLNNTSKFSTTILMDKIKKDADADLFLGNESMEEKELYVAHLKNQNFIFRGRLYEGEKLLNTKEQKIKLKLKDVTSISLSNNVIIF